MKTDKWYHKRLREYFMDHYGIYENDSEWFVNPAPNKWKCYLPGPQLTITFTCDDAGNVTEDILELDNRPEVLYSIVQAAGRGMDALYEDFIIHLVGEKGFQVLRARKNLLTCGSIDGRNLYTLN